MDEELGTQDWDDFIKEIKTTFSNKTKIADAKWRIESFKQGKKNTVNFMIEFEALAMKVDIDELHIIFSLKSLNSTPGNSMFNINLNYDINQVLDLEE